MTFSELAEKIRLCPCDHLVRVIAVDGGAGSGKTTFAYRLAEALACPVIQLDDFIAFTNLERWWPRFEEQVLGPMFRGEAAVFQIRDWENDVHGEGLGDWKTLEWTPTVVIEGVGAARMNMDGRLTFRIWIEVDADERMRRGIERDHEQPNIQAVWEAWMPFEAEFLSRERSWERADLVVDGTVFVAEGPDAGFEVLRIGPEGSVNGPSERLYS